MKKLPTPDQRIVRSILVLNFPFSLLFVLLFQFSTEDLQAQCNGNTVLSITGSATGTSSTWTAPATGGPFSISISATGAGGGDVTGWTTPDQGGSGATMSGTFTVQNGQTIRAIAGWRGEDGPDVGAGGGGGSGAVNCGNPSNCAGGTVLIVAAGGNGDNGPGGVGLGGSDTEGDGQGGPSGANDEGGGGGGFLTNGGNAPGSGGGGGAKISLISFSVGGTGSGTGGGDGGNGMGGAGGGGSIGSGGGGGHTGGSGDNLNPAKSFNSSSNQSNSPGNDAGGPNLGTVVIVCLGPLPVELINFKALIQDNSDVMLLWSTASEKDNLGYDVERSVDNRNWSSLAFVQGNGTTTDKQEYTYHDDKPFAGVNYYRLKQMDTDGKYQYTPMVVADVRGGGSQFDVFPNPSAGGTMSVRAVSTQEGDATLEVFTWAGLKVYKETFRVYEGTIVSPLDMSTFPKGTYTARLEMPDGTAQFKKIVLQ
ncbi:MAG TPA: T9SS type A sorting domain-containing protein [Saprospiraceae bacterium]|nr:T9SS type A sorting domain-containing protein [Saprospiraceae bacterium]